MAVQGQSHHYVPQAYLRRFKDKNGLLHAFDKVERRVLVPRMKNAAAEPDFYLLPGDTLEPGADPNFVEKELLNRIDNDFARALSELLGRVQTHEGKPIVSLADKTAFGEALALQLLRTNSFRKVYVQLQEKGIKAITQLMMSRRPEMPGDFDVVFRKECAALHQAALLMFDEEVVRWKAAEFASCTWRFGVNETTVPLWTSDTPIVRRRHRPPSPYDYLSWVIPGIETVYPLSQSVILVMTDPHHFTDFKDQDGMVFSIGRNKDTEAYNVLQVEQSDRQVFSPTADFSLAERICLEKPEVCDPDRERARVDWGPGPFVWATLL